MAFSTDCASVKGFDEICQCTFMFVFFVSLILDVFFCSLFCSILLNYSINVLFPVVSKVSYLCTLIFILQCMKCLPLCYRNSLNDIVHYNTCVLLLQYMFVLLDTDFHV